MILILLLLVAALVLSPVSAQLDLRCDEAAELRLVIGMGMIRRKWRLRLDESGLQTSRQDEAPQTVTSSGLRQSASGLLRIVRRAGSARRFLVRHIQLRSLCACATIGGQAASHTALLTGTVNTLCGFITPSWRQRTLIRVMPDFRRLHSALWAQCIISCKLGILIITAAMLGMQWLREKIAAGKEA